MTGPQPSNIEHLHPRHLRRAFFHVAAPYRALHEPLRPVKAGQSTAKPAHAYRGARDHRKLSTRPCDRLKAERKALGVSRHEYERIRNTARKAV